MKLLDIRGRPNDGAVRLQLYEYVHCVGNRAPRHRDHTPPVYFEMITQKILGRHAYPSTLSVNVHGITSPTEREVKGRRPLLPTDIEVGRVPFDEMKRRIHDTSVVLPGHSVDTKDSISYARQRLLLRQRLPDEECLVPKKQLHRLSCGQIGCFVLDFSPDGRYVAAGCGEQIMFPIKVNLSHISAYALEDLINLADFCRRDGST